MAERGARTRAILDQECTFCQSISGYPCTNHMGQAVRYFHAARQHDAARVLMTAASERNGVLVTPTMASQIAHERANQHPWPQEH